HRARVAAKHLRYLLEPFAPAVSGGETTVDRLKALQDGFGDVHDAHVFGTELREALAEEIANLVDRDREVERKFLLTGLPTLPGAGSPVEIEQGYLPGERLIER